MLRLNVNNIGFDFSSRKKLVLFLLKHGLVLDLVNSKPNFKLYYATGVFNGITPEKEQDFKEIKAKEKDFFHFNKKKGYRVIKLKPIRIWK